ncbi:vanillate O-demethylase ferredoxin subunit [Acidovorax sp. 100]|uniref:PDR/VanB family oxidoreductase n=1 Tax=Acidovorax sp. 100 TaxID=2135635 RepID=UPI000EF9B197|nr:PDR/VanB family oxidoreductase [Acidovorax sp. 100]RMA59936.1 vanillate O-demethylase ferredoxin subunit [Acidovorax sp. 100]
MKAAASLKVRVQRKTIEAIDICTFELVSADGLHLPAFSAGSHIDVELPGSITRQYSLCNESGETHRYVIGVLKDQKSRGGSRALHEEVNEGDVLTISPPRNHFALAHAANHSILFAGGIGITPILCMAERLAAIGESFEMHYCARSRERTAFLPRIGSSSFAPKVHFHFDDGPDEQKLKLESTLKSPAAGVQLYVCGPKGFMDAVLSNAREHGWSEDQLHYEFFGAAPEKSESDGSFEVQLASSGRIVLVSKEQTVVHALEDAGVPVLVSCEQGVCGTCLTRVLEGEPDHRDMFLTKEEHAKNDQFLPCCSRSKSPRLVLDL